MTIVLGIDIGSTTTKVALVEVGDSARLLRVARAATADDAPGLLACVSRLARECAEATQTPIAAVGVASMAETGIPLDRHGAPLTPLVRWDRGERQETLVRLMRRHPGLAERTGIPATPKPALIALHWLRDERPEAFARLARWQSVADLVAGALTGAHATDHTLAARTMMLDGRVPADRRWNADLLGELGLSTDALPRILAPGEAAGSTTAAAFGLPAGIPVHIAGHDHPVGAWGAGVRAPGDVADSLGTAEAVMAIAEKVDAAAVGEGFSIGRTVDDRFATVMGGSPACGALLAAWPGSADLLSAEPVDSWRTSPVTILPYPQGRQCPAPDAGARVRVIGAADAPGDLERGLLQSLVLHARWMRTAMARHADTDSNRLVLLGSLAERIPAWAPLTAAAGAGEVRRCTSTEPVAAGAALLAAVRAGLADERIGLPSAPAGSMRADGLEAAYQDFVNAALEPRHPDHSEGET